MRRFMVLTFAALLAIGSLAVAACGQDPAHGEQASAIWQCPMHPQIVLDHEGDCPICGMRLVQVEEPAETAPAAADPHAAHRHGAAPVAGDAVPEGGVAGRAPVSIDPARQQLIGLRTAQVERRVLGSAFSTPARVEADPDRVRKVTVKVGGTVERVAVDAVGRRVRPGAALFALYSPELQVAQDELLLALRTRERLAAAGAEGGDTLVEAARRKLRLLDVPTAEIARVEAGGEPLRTLAFASPVGGLVSAREVVDGDVLQAGDLAFEITDLDSVWVLADARQADLPRLAAGQPVAFTVDALPRRVWQGEVALIEPLLDADTRSARVHVHLENPDGALVPGMYGRAEFALGGEERLSIPADAVLPAGTRDLAFVALGEGRFVPRELTLGLRDGERVEVLAGLAEGEEVVTRAAFLMDSESSLRAALAGME